MNKHLYMLTILRYKSNDKNNEPSFTINNNLLIQLNYLFRFQLQIVVESNGREEPHEVTKS